MEDHETRLDKRQALHVQKQLQHIKPLSISIVFVFGTCRSQAAASASDD